MKSLLRISAIMFVALSFGGCQTDKEEAEPATFVGTWRLETVVSGGTGEPFAARELGYELYYTLYENMTFRKYGTTGAVNTGSYTLQKIDDRIYAVLVIEENKEAGNGMPIGISCHPGLFYLYLEGNTLHDNNMACDIGNYIYRKIIDAK